MRIKASFGRDHATHDKALPLYGPLRTLMCPVNGIHGGDPELLRGADPHPTGWVLQRDPPTCSSTQRLRIIRRIALPASRSGIKLTRAGAESSNREGGREKKITSQSL